MCEEGINTFRTEKAHFMYTKNETYKHTVSEQKTDYCIYSIIATIQIYTKE